MALTHTQAKANNANIIIKAARHPVKSFVVIIAFYAIVIKLLSDDETVVTPVLRKEPAPDKYPPVQLTTTICDSPLRDHFDKIYETDHWGAPLRDVSAFYGDAKWPIPPDSPRLKSASGHGSDLGVASETSLKIIKDTIEKYNVKSMIDVPCGDVNWIFDSFVTDSLPLYIGLDIARFVIDSNKQRYAHHSNKHFMFWDATLCPFPKFYNYTISNEPQNVDLIHVRDVIQHVTLKQGVAYFCNVFKSGARVMITTTYPREFKNADVNEGSWYKNNLLLEPFSFPATGKCTPSHPTIENDDTCVYDLSEAWVQDFIKAKCN